jgi:hypothetical protein
VSFGIEKVESTPDGDLMVYGKATDGSVDHDMQIVDPGFSSKAISDWLSTGGNVRVQHNPQRDPAGIGVEASTDESGATWVKSLIVEPVAKRLVSKGVLRAYSVGIANPTIERDLTGKARGGIIKSGKIVEISLVDRPANASCGFQLVKSASDGHAEFTGEVFGDEQAIAKALDAEVTKSDAVVSDISSFDFESMKIDFTPNDMWRIMQEKMAKQRDDDVALKAIAEAERAVYKRDVSTAERRSLASAGHALADGSYPIANEGDLHNAAHLARTGHGNAEGAKKLIARRAKELGVANPLEDGAEKVIPAPEVTAEVKEAVPAIIKDPAAGGGSDPTPGKSIPKPSSDEDNDQVEDQATGKAAKAPKPAKGKKGKKLPPWLNKPADGDDAKSVQGDAEKCDMDPKTASGAEEPADMNPAPLGDLKEYPAKPHMKSESAVMRFKTIGIDTDLGIMHDMTCPAFSPEQTAEFFPFADFTTLVDEGLWQRKALAAAAGKSIAEATEAQQAWQSAVLLRNSDQGMLNDFRAEAHKAFRDANPGVSSFPTPGAMSPRKYNRPCITDGHAAHSQGYGSPTTAPRIPDGSPNAHSFGRPPLTSAHQSPSPSHMKSSFEYPEQQGVPTQIRYAVLEKDKARRALSMMHDHLAHMFPASCPMIEQDAYRQEDGHTLNLPVGLGKMTETPETAVLGDVYKYISKLEKQVRAGLITEEQARTKLSKRTAKKYAENLQRQVQKGITSRDAVLKALGIEIPPAETAAKAAVVSAPPEPEVSKSLTPEVMKTMMSDILTPFEERIAAQDKRIEDLLSENASYKQQVDSLREKEEVHDRRWEALANERDPSTTAFPGLALNPAMHTTRPAGIVQQAEISKSVQGMMMRQLERTWRTSENPAEREAAYAALLKYQGKTD